VKVEVPSSSVVGVGLVPDSVARFWLSGRIDRGC